MRIKYKTYFICGIIDIIIGVACFISGICLNSGAKIVLTFIPIIWGVTALVHSIETKAERERRIEELRTMAKLYGWDKDSDVE